MKKICTVGVLMHSMLLCLIGAMTVAAAATRACAQGSTKQEQQEPQPRMAVAVAPEASGAPTEAQPANTEPQGVEQPAAPAPSAPIDDSLTASDNVSLDFKDADITNVLKIISYKAGINIVSTPDVIGTVTIKLTDVPWEQALDVILKTYGYGYQRQGNVILVTKLENIAKIQSEESLKTEIITLKFLDAQDAQKILIPLLSPRGKISILYARGQKGWKFGTFQIGKNESKTGELNREEDKAYSETIALERNPGGGLVTTKAEFQPSIKSKTLVITDTATSIDTIKSKILPQIDKKPKQVLIETKIMEVNIDKLKDFGFDWGTGSTGAESSAVSTTRITGNKGGVTETVLGGHSLGSEVSSSIFSPKATSITGTEPYNAGLELVFKKLTGTQFEAILHALEEDVGVNTLSAPHVLTLDNQEAAILVGFHTPILRSEVTAGSTTSGTGTTVTQTLDYYQEIGIRLNVVPQVNEDNYINMIIHPSVTSSSSNVTATSTASGVTTETDYPVIDVRETQTQILIKDGETVVIGGLLKDVKSKSVIGIPLISKLPFIGKLFTRETYDSAKVDLLIFINARIITDDDFSAEEIARLEKRVEMPKPMEKGAKAKK